MDKQELINLAFDYVRCGIGTNYSRESFEPRMREVYYPFKKLFDELQQEIAQLKAELAECEKQEPYGYERQQVNSGHWVPCSKERYNYSKEFCDGMVRETYLKPFPQQSEIPLENVRLDGWTDWYTNETNDVTIVKTSILKRHLDGLKPDTPQSSVPVGYNEPSLAQQLEFVTAERDGIRAHRDSLLERFPKWVKIDSAEDATTDDQLILWDGCDYHIDYVETEVEYGTSFFANGTQATHYLANVPNPPSEQG